MAVSQAYISALRDSETESTVGLLDNRASIQIAPQFNFLLEFTTHFIVDDSQSMFGDKWQRAREALLGAASNCEMYGAPGFSVSFLHHEPVESSSGRKAYNDVKTAAEIKDIFRNVRTAAMDNAKPTGMRLRGVLERYFAMFDETHDGRRREGNGRLKPFKVIIITDGIPTDDLNAVITSLRSPTAPQYPDLGSDQVNIEFWQVGNNGPTTAFLYKTGMLRNIPRVSDEEAQRQRRWKYDLEDGKGDKPSKNFVKFMAVNMLKSAAFRT